MTEPDADVSREYNPAQFRRVFVEDQSRLLEVIGELSASDAIGVDLEMVQRVERHPGGLQDWIQVLALIQIASEEVSVVIDPVRCRDLSSLEDLMSGQVRKVFLGGGQDAALLEKTGIPARNVVDVGEVALAVFGRREDGMAALARRIFGLSLDKTVRRADWLARPLNPALLTYAHRDAELTLLIYRWFQQHQPEALTLHTRRELDPLLTGPAPLWLQEAVSKASVDPLAVVMEHDLHPEKDRESLEADVALALDGNRSPRQINRLLRVAGDLELKALLPRVLPLVQSRSSLIRAAAARAVGQLAEPEAGEPILQVLMQDPIEDVRKAAQAALRDLQAPKSKPSEEAEEEGPSLNQNALSALQQLMEQLEDKTL
jgi:3'-5' exonuclease/HEAT repeats